MSGAFSLSPEHEEFRAAARRFAEEKIAPHAAEADDKEQFPWPAFEAYRDTGFVGVQFPEAYGGQGADPVTNAILIEEVARVCASSSLFVIISKLGMIPLLQWGTDTLRRKYVPRVASGEMQASYCLSEAAAGSDVASMTTKATPDGDDWVLSGRKMWITNAGVSDLYTVFAKTDPEAGHRGISCFVVESAFEGFSIGKLEHKMGVRGSPTGEIVLDDVRVPGENLVGEVDRGFYYAMATLDRSRPGIGAQAVGIAQGALDWALRYVNEREQFGHAIAEFQGLQFMLADMATRIEAARLLVYRACALMDDAAQSDGLTKAGAMAKLFAADTAMQVTTDAVQLLGGAGYTREHPVERMMRDAKITQIYEGTNQIQRVVIAKRLLGSA
ncbi:MAG TPA: acyl-CoA dehydrogenase family protein [Acidimicrobiia bacterium]|nr:acyl-CoA dehydrogenase family protein [Acidimicrobiia bacterium]